jgi:RNA-directed DNA polymerase
MTADSSAGAASHLSPDWQAIPWKTVNETVRRLQARIVQATKAGKWHKVHALQHWLTHSCSGKALAVRRVTENQGKNTPGVDTVLWKAPESKGMARHQMQRRGYKARPLRRVYIPQSNGKKRPLSLPMCSAYCISCARLLGIVLAEPAYVSQLHWAQAVSLIRATAAWPHRCCLPADTLCVLPPHLGSYTTRGPHC